MSNIHIDITKIFVAISATIFMFVQIADARELVDPLGVPFFDPGVSSACEQQSSAGIKLSPNKVFVIGDSITVGATKQLESALQGQGLIPVINGVSGRRLSVGSTEKDGQSILETQTTRDTVSESGAVVVALGTNSGLSATSITSAIETIKGANPNARILWVNIGVNSEKRRGSSLDPTGTNSALALASRSAGFTVVDWANLVSQNPDYINDDGLGVHLTDEGSRAFAQAVVTSLGGQSVGGSCAVDLRCEENEKAVWDFFASKGLQSHVIAGFLGNMQEEAHFEPRLVEYGWRNSRGEVSRAGSSTSLDNQIPPNQNEKGQPGYGIIQFTSPGRKAHLQAVADEMGAPPCAIGVQLEAVWRELNGPYKSSTLDPLMTSSNERDAARIITYHYEIPSNKEAAAVRRGNNAAAYLLKYGSGGY